MPTYIYFCENHQEFEIYHSINERLEFCPKCQEEGKEVQVKRLISGGSGFILSGDCWAKDSYSK